MPCGEVLGGRYELLGLVGRGGMGTVYRARDRELGETVALKVLHDVPGDPSIVERFRQEVRLARRVTHRNVARTFDIGEHGDVRFLTMEYVDGQALSERIRSAGGAMPVSEAIDILLAICDGLIAAHAMGVIHRDLKPDNVLIASNGRVVITDFGIARSSSEASMTSGIVGTPAYMSPEQAEGKIADHRADIYALGTIAYELLTGARAWPGEGAIAVAAARLVAPPPDPRLLRLEISPELATTVVRMMGRSPEDRFHDITTLRATLQAAGSRGAARAPRSSVQVTQRPTDGATGHVLAVLPFRNTGDPADAYVADALTEDLIDTLSMQASVRVRSRAAARAEAVDAVSAGKSLGVDVVVEGHVRRTGDGYRLTARLISIQDGFQLWAMRCETREADLLATLDDLARAIAEALASTLRGPVRQSPEDPQAIDLYLRARVALRDAWHDATLLEAAVRLFEAARARAPQDAHILSGFAMARARLEFFGVRSLETDRATEAAVLVAPHVAEAWIALALLRLYRNEMSSVVPALRKALALSPALARPHEILGRLLLEAGAMEEATTLLTRALELDPSTIEPRWDLIRAHALRGAWSHVDALLALETSGDAADTMFSLTRARTHLWHKHVDPSVGEPALDRRDQIDSSIFRLMIGMFRGLARTGSLDPHAREAYDAFLAPFDRTSRGFVIGSQYLAEFMLASSQPAEGLDFVAQAVHAGLADLGWMDHCPLLGSVRASPQWPGLREVVAGRARGIVESVG